MLLGVKKRDIEPNFHEHTTLNVKDYPGKPKRQNSPKNGFWALKRGLKVKNRKSLSWPEIGIE